MRRFGAEQRQFRMSVATYTAGRHVRAEISKEYSLPLDRVVAVGGGLNPVPQSGVPRQEGRVLFVGYDFERKGGDVLLRAFSKVTVPNAELVIVGPEARPSADPRVRWVGRLSDRQELADLYASAAVFVLPALFEPYGLVIAEAMNSGLPCVVSDANELPRLVEDEVSGIVVPRGDDQSLAVALERLLGDPCLRVRLGDAAQRSIATEGLTWRDVASRMIADIGPRVGN
ncbi:glycosyltransferase family 4 protein [Microbacterium sp. AG1240]|uniref:glycosyltransferase family 4 protein n=1 Tax=Microbacterium sp. AG1240 TaxID=2183992 RepID=UPI0037CA7727